MVSLDIPAGLLRRLDGVHLPAEGLCRYQHHLDGTKVQPASRSLSILPLWRQGLSPEPRFQLYGEMQQAGRTQGNWHLRATAAGAPEAPSLASHRRCSIRHAANAAIPCRSQAAGGVGA